MVLKQDVQVVKGLLAEIVDEFQEMIVTLTKSANKKKITMTVDEQFFLD